MGPATVVSWRLQLQAGVPQNQAAAFFGVSPPTAPCFLIMSAFSRQSSTNLQGLSETTSKNLGVERMDWPASRPDLNTMNTCGNSLGVLFGPE